MKPSQQPATVNLVESSSQAERQRKILELIVSAGQVYVHELAAYFNVTPETIRRDLSRLETQNLLRKVHGGAVNFTFNTGLDSQLKFEHAFHERTKLAETAKKAIAKEAIKLISPGDTLFVDFGSTTLEFARELHKINNLTVLSNSPLIADILQVNHSIDVILLGGQFIGSKFECLGSVTLNSAAQFFADFAVIGTGAMHKEKGFMDQDINEAAIAKKMIAQSHKTIVLADASKLGNQAMALVARWAEVDYLVTNAMPPDWQSMVIAHRPQLILAQEPTI